MTTPPSSRVARPVCQTCGEPITEPSLHIENSWWQCPDCHHIEFGSWPFGEDLSLPDDHLKTPQPNE